MTAVRRVTHRSRTRYGLQIELFFRFKRHKAHARALYSLSDGFRINVVALVGFHVWLHILCRHQPRVMSLLLKWARQEMRSATGLDTDAPNTIFAVKVSSCVREQRLRMTTFPVESIATR